MKAGHEVSSQHTTTSLVYGRDLTPTDIDAINLNRRIEFNAEPIRFDPANENWGKPYFLVKNEDELLAFGRLHSIEVELQDRVHEILGIATIIAIRKGEGHGKTLMTYMKQYIEETGMTAIGFCDPSKSEFYRKCGFSIIPNGIRRFTFLNEEEEATEPTYPDSDVLYIDGNDHLGKVLVADQSTTIVAHRVAW